MNEQPQKRAPLPPAYLVVVAVTPFVLAVTQVLFGSAPIDLLWFGLAMSMVAFLLFRLLSGYAPLGRRKLRFGQPAQLKLWQTPVFWLPFVVVAIAVGFLWYVG